MKSVTHRPKPGVDRDAFLSCGPRPPLESCKLFRHHRLANPILYRREEAEACWARTQAPVLLVRGDADDARAHGIRAAAEGMRAHIRNLEIVTVPGAGHMVHHEEPEALARAIVDFERAVSGGIRAARPPIT